MRSSTAELWLSVWGENVRLRAGGDVGRGIGEGGQYRPADDPHPSSWVCGQVPLVLKNASPEERRLAELVYVGGRTVHSCRHEFGGRYRTGKIHKQLLKRVGMAVIGHRERTISEAHAMRLLEDGVFDGPGWKAIFDYFASRR